jgi:nicotinate-nucleotide adenylyltransferase
MLKLPPFGDGQRIGLFGGSFNPAHRGHYMVALFALKRLQLDWVWWMVSPQNPLKNAADTRAFGDRIASTRQIARHPRFVVTDLEQQLGSTYTAETIAKLAAARRRAQFVWIMGADSLANLHRWHDWISIAEAMPLAVLARPGYSLRALGSYAALRFDDDQVPAEQSVRLASTAAPAWTFITMPLRPESSTAIRAMAETTSR